MLVQSSYNRELRQSRIAFPHTPSLQRSNEHSRWRRLTEFFDADDYDHQKITDPGIDSDDDDDQQALRLMEDQERAETFVLADDDSHDEVGKTFCPQKRRSFPTRCVHVINQLSEHLFQNQKYHPIV